jgi:1-acyl-sn-glycerol-3-phosphate acyltransferase
MLQIILRSFFRFLFRMLTRTSLIGRENIPKSGGYLICANHISLLDAPLVYIQFDRNDVTGLVAKKHQKNPFLRWLVNEFHGIWLNRDEADTHAIRAARDHLQSGGCLGIAPEGTRSPDGKMHLAKTGVAFLADRCGVPVIPVAISGTDRAFKLLKRLKRPPLSIQFGEPFHLPPLNREDRDTSLRGNTDEIMCRIAIMLPPQQRGVYASHPRLQELSAKDAGPEILAEKS